MSTTDETTTTLAGDVGGTSGGASGGGGSAGSGGGGGASSGGGGGGSGGPNQASDVGVTPNAIVIGTIVAENGVLGDAFAPAARGMRAWAQAAVFATVVGVSAFHWLTPHDTLIPWKSFSRAELARLTSEGHTVLVDFTADWCLTCKMNLNFAIETEDVRKAIESNNVVPLLADWTDGSPEIKSALESLKSNSIPLLAVYPAGKTDAIVLRDVISKQQVLDAIKAAGPAKAASKDLVSSTP